LDRNDLSDSVRIEMQLALAWNYFFVNIDSARKVLKECLQLTSRDNNYPKMGDAYTYLGTSYYQTDDYDSALIYYREAETCYKRDTSAQAEVNIAANRMSMGTAFLQRGDHQTALNAYLQAINILEKAEDYGNQVTAYANIGLVYNDLKQYDKALFYHQKAWHICLAHPSEIEPVKTAQVKMFTVIDHLNLKRYDDARRALHQSDYMVKALGSDYISTIFYNIQGRYYHELKQYKASIASFRQSLQYAGRSGNQFQQANSFQQLGINYFMLEEYKESIVNLRRSIAVSRKIGDKIRERKTLEYLSKAYAKTHNNSEAVKYYEQYIQLSDSLNESETKKKINETENRFQARKKQDSILVLQKNNQLQQLSIKRKETINITVIVSALLLALSGLLFYRNLRNKHYLLKQSEELNMQRIQELEKERRLVAMQSVMKGQEQERSRLARDLHDGVGGLLSGIKLSLSTMKGNVFLSEENAMAVNHVISQLDQSIAELRRVSHNMMPEALIKYGLKEALENYCENMNLSGTLKVQLQTYGMERRMEQDTEIVLYRIVQELLNNVVKHAGAESVLIQLIQEKNHFSLTVEDDGTGFDLAEAERKDGAGLANVRARADYLGATVDFRSVPGEGTSVNIEGNC
jgi:signal transduction histidine kinase